MTVLLTTYTLPRPFEGFNIPIAIQSAFMRDYATRANYQFALPVTEITTSNSYLMLKKLLRAERSTHLNLAVCSGFVFPVNAPDVLRAIFFDDVADDLSISIHLVLEGLLLDRDGLIDWARNLGKVRNLVKSYDTLDSYAD